MAELGPEKALIFRITHVRNLQWILRHGLHCQNSPTRDPDFIPIGMPDLIQKRQTREVEIPPGGVLADYVPFYFTPFSIMMYHIKTGYNGITKRGNSEIAVLVSSLHKLKGLRVPFLFTDGHAYTFGTNFFNDLRHLDQLDWPLLRSRDFRNDPEDPGKQTRYQAEALVHKHVPIEALLGIGCFDESTRSAIKDEAKACGVRVEVKVSNRFYF